MTRNPFALCDEINELLKNGMLTLNAKLGDVPDEKLVSRLVEVWSFFFGTVLPYFEGVFLPLQIDLKMYHSRKITRKNTGGTNGGSFSSISSSGGGGGTIGTAGGSLLSTGGGLESSMIVSSPKMALEQERNEDSEPENVRIMALTGFRDLVILPMVDRLGGKYFLCLTFSDLVREVGYSRAMRTKLFALFYIYIFYRCVCQAVHGL